MTFAPEIVFDNMEPSEAIAAKVREKAQKLAKIHPRLTNLRFVIDAPHRHHHKGKIYNVKIAIGLPGHPEILVSSHDQNPAHEDVYVALRDAFEAARRRLVDTVERRQSEDRAHRG
jgi:ribosome-associated translation inhibitor RaiA